MANVTTFKRDTIIYYSALTLLIMWFLASGFMEITKNPKVWDKTIQMGYPPYFILLLGYAKISGMLVLAIPRKLIGLKEWVFAGLVFDVVFAFASGFHLSSIAGCITPAIALLLILFTHTMFRRINGASYSPRHSIHKQ